MLQSGKKAACQATTQIRSRYNKHRYSLIFPLIGIMLQKASTTISREI